MKTLTRTLFITLLLAFFSQNAVAAVLGKVTNQRLDDSRDVISLFFDGQSKPEIFFIPGDSPRLVLDFPDTSHKGQQKIAADGAVLRAIRIATHQNPLKTRVVFDLRTGSVDYKQEFLEDGHILRISLSGKGSPPPKTAAAPQPPAKPLAAPAAPAKTETVASVPAKPETVTSPPVKTETAASPPAKTETVTLPPAPKETISPPPAALPAEPSNEPPLAAQERAEQGAGATKPTPFDSPFLNAEAPAKPAALAAPAGKTGAAAPAATRMLDYSLVDQPAESDVLRLQLDGYADPEITANEGPQPQLVCFFPKMRLEVKKGINHPVSGKFVRKVVVEAQKKPLGVKLLIDLQGGHDYYVQKIFNADESAFFLAVNISKH
jgi:hypothetical protein